MDLGCFSAGLLLAGVVAGVVGYRRLVGRLARQSERLDALETTLARLRASGAARSAEPTSRAAVAQAAGASAARETAAAITVAETTAPAAPGAPAGQPVSAEIAGRPRTPREGAHGETGDTAAHADQAASPATQATGAAPAASDTAAAAGPGTAGPASAEGVSAPSLPRGARPSAAVDWERWLGVRGAALLGGVVLALAGFLFLRYAIDRGLLSPTVRVVLALLGGVIAVSGSEVQRWRGYPTTANALAGAGIVLLYAGTWAGHVLYGLFGAGVALPAFVAATLLCGYLAWRHGSRVIALLGLVGGFATPLLLSRRLDDPVGLFGYLLLLDAGLWALARRRGWGGAMVLAVVATAGYEALWTFGWMGPDGADAGLVVLAVVALGFVAAGELDRRRARAGGVGALTQATALLPAFGLALYFAARSDLGLHLGELAALLLVLSGAALWVGRTQHLPGAPLAAVLADLALVLVAVGQAPRTTALPWQTAAVAVSLAIVFHLGHELDRRRGWPHEDSAGEGGAAVPPATDAAAATPSGGTFAGVGAQPATRYAGADLVAAAGLLGLLALFAVWIGRPQPSLLPWLAGWVLLAALLERQAGGPGAAWRQAPAGLGLGCGLAGFFLFHVWAPAAYPPTVGWLVDPIPASPIRFLACTAGVLGALTAVAMARRLETTRRWAWIAAALAGLPLLLAVPFEADRPGFGFAAGLAIHLALVAWLVLVCARIPSGGGFVMLVLVAVWQQTLWTRGGGARYLTPQVALGALGLQLVTVLLLTTVPWLARRLRPHRGVAVAAALAAPLWLPAISRLWDAAAGERAAGLPAVTLAAISAGAWLAARRHSATGVSAAAPSWFAGAALALLVVAMPMQLDREWITLGWAIEGAAVLWLWRRSDHAGLKYLGLGLLAVVVLRLVANPAVLAYHPRGGTPFVNWLAWTYLPPAAALLGGLFALRGLETPRLHSWELRVWGRRPLGTALCGAGAALVFFAWLNLAIVDAFAHGERLRLTLDHLPARDLALSLAWILYAVALLALGMSRRSSALRWLSLAFLVLAIAKVFLYDLGELEDLYRVASLVGLALSLLGVSLAYQRFVFGRR